MSDDDDVVRPIRPKGNSNSGSSSGLRKWQSRILFIAVPLLLVAGSLLRLWVDFLWFDALAQRDVLITRLQWSAIVGLGSGLVAFAILYGNFIVVRRVAKNDLYVPFLSPGADPEAPEQPIIPQFLMKPILLGVAVLGGVFAGLIMSGNWETVLRFVGRTDFGITDPQFGRDASFYVFTMPLLEMIVRFFQVMVIISVLAVVVSYVALGVIRYVPVPRIARPAIRHLSALAAAFLLVSAIQFRLAIWNLVSSTTGAATGVSWADEYARIPGFYVMMVASVLLAGAVVYFTRKQRWRFVGGSIGVWFALNILVTAAIPSIVQQALVDPNEFDREQTVLKGNISLTRAAWNLDKMDRREFRDQASLERSELLEDNTGTTDNIRLWSPPVLGDVMQQTQSLRRYYSFLDIDVDRYNVNGDYRQVMLGVRELDPTKVASSWTNQRLLFTHGYGAIAAWPNEATSNGRPNLLIQDIPPKSTGQDDLTIERPQVYFGEMPDHYVVANSKQQEIDYPEGEENKLTRYEGEGGVNAGGFARRVAFATAFGDPQLLLTRQIKKDSKVMFRRNVKERVAELAPFLTLDDDPYAVLHKGGIVWVIDGYTTSERFPYSEFAFVGAEIGDGPVNYARNSVKAVVDAYSGEVTLYAIDKEDPILKAWISIFPDLFEPIESMDDELRDNIRYPEDLFDSQTSLWNRYHMGNVQTFYQDEDLWEVPVIDGVEMDAFYVLARLPGEEQEELLLIRPVVPKERPNMIAYMVARSDGSAYGELITYALDKRSLTQGPQQVQALIKQDPNIAEQIALWSRGGNTPIFGNLLVLPVEQSLMYVQPVYLKNQGAEIPEYQRVVVVLGEKVAWGDTFEEAVTDLLGGGGDTGSQSSDDQKDDTTEQPDESDTPDESDPPDESNDLDLSGLEGLSEAELREAITEANTQYERAIECQRDGDWECYGEALEALDEALTPAN